MSSLTYVWTLGHTYAMMSIETLGFEWDTGNQDKCRKHGVSPSEIEAFFRQDTLYIAPDIFHSEQEQRFLAIGRDSTGKPLFVVFTLRENNEGLLIRPISARYMHAKEVRKYEEAFAGNTE
jgi:uncharacterized protein